MFTIMFFLLQMGYLLIQRITDLKILGIQCTVIQPCKCLGISWREIMVISCDRDHVLKDISLIELYIYTQIIMEM